MRNGVPGPETKEQMNTVEVEIGGKTITLETGRLAQQANGAEQDESCAAAQKRRGTPAHHSESWRTPIMNRTSCAGRQPLPSSFIVTREIFSTP